VSPRAQLVYIRATIMWTVWTIIYVLNRCSLWLLLQFRRFDLCISVLNAVVIVVVFLNCC